MPVDTDQPEYISCRDGYTISERPHLGGADPNGDPFTFMPDVWEIIFNYLNTPGNTRSAVDVGCGFGYFVEWCLKRVIMCVGVEAERESIVHSRAREHVFVHDYSDGPLLLNREYDLAWSAEFVQQVAPEFIPNYMATFRACRYACITHARPGDSGHHAVNSQHDNYWVDMFGAHGFRHDPRMSDALRATRGINDPRGRVSLMFFKRTGPTSVKTKATTRIVTPDSDGWPPS